MLVLFVSSLLVALGGQETNSTPRSPCPDSLLGAWRIVDPPDGVPGDLMLRLEPDRMTQYQDGRIVSMERIIGYADDVLRTAGHSEPRLTELWREDDQLGMVRGNEILVLENVIPVPAALISAPSSQAR